MAEICMKPLNITIGDVEYEAFSEAHSLSDIVRWLMVNPVDAEEVYYMLGAAMGQNAAVGGGGEVCGDDYNERMAARDWRLAKQLVATLCAVILCAAVVGALSPAM